jgi:sugar (pentulose or hexulose) kinase
MIGESGAIAIDLGATSMRFAAARIEDDSIGFEIVEQAPNAPLTTGPRTTWDFSRMLAFCRQAVEYGGTHFRTTTIGLDSWGVDHGFLDESGNLIQPVVCYRDRSHADVFDRFAPIREELYRLTGIQHQPFNTIYQLIARREEDSTLPRRAACWRMLPDLLAHQLCGVDWCELTDASTTQLMGLDGRWCPRAFELAGWPVPELQPQPPGKLTHPIHPGADLVMVAGHDTASAVVGFGTLADDLAFLNVGTWSLLGCLLDVPIVTQEAEASGFSNERAADGKVRFLTNIPGFYVVNRLHEELGLDAGVPQWLAACYRGKNETTDAPEPKDLMDPLFFNPPSMRQALHPEGDLTVDGWGRLALESISATTAAQLRQLELVAGRAFRALRVAGGGSQCPELCQSLADRCRIPVLAGPAEATVLGNLALQFLAREVASDMRQALQLVDRSFTLTRYEPLVAR